VDTVEWGTVEPDRQRGPSLRLSIPRVGALTLALAGFLALLAAEVLPWASIHVPASVAAAVRPNRLPFNDGQALTLDRLQSIDVLAYHLAAVFGLAGTAARRRATMGAALGLCTGLGLTTVSLVHAAGHFVDNYLTYFIYTGADTPDTPTTGIGPGPYLAFVGTALLAACAVTAGLWQRGGSAGRAGTPAAGRPAAGDQPEVTVTALEPVDEAYFARPDTR